MGQRQFPSLNGIVQSDTAATGSALVERDSNGDVFGVRGRFSAGMRSGGDLYRSVTAKSANFSADDTMDVCIVDTSAGSVTVSLPAAATCAGKVLTFKKKVAANSLILDGNAAETIDGAATLTKTSQYDSVTIICDGTTWWVID
jgi:hypothetical protein